MSINTLHSTRIDLLELYQRLQRYTSLRARPMVTRDDSEGGEFMVITESDFHTVNPMIRLAFAQVADELGTTTDFKLSGFDALEQQGLVDWKNRLASGEDTRYVVAVYNLPNESGKNVGYTSAYHEIIYEALAMNVLTQWFMHLGLMDISNSYRQSYALYIRQLLSFTANWAAAPKSRRPVNL